jgi:Domain of unknown function (DUF4417)
MREYGFPHLRSDLLATVVPDLVYAGGSVTDPARSLFVWRTCTFPPSARGGVLAFYTDDYRFECLWRQPHRYAEQFRAFGWGAVLEPDFSTWRDAPLVEQLWAIYRMRSLGRLYQDYGINIIPNLAWSDERSFEFAFTGIPRGVPVAACEARTAGQCDDDRRRFLAGLTSAVEVVQPTHLVVYGGTQNEFWLKGRLPPGPQYTLLPSWTSERDQMRKQEKRTLRDRDQLNLFVKGAQPCTDSTPAPVS